jgi:hypothetical protein
LCSLPTLPSKGLLMKKSIAAITAGLLLVAGQAAAAGQASATTRVGDRVGAVSADSSEFAGIPLPVLLIGAAVVAATIVVASDDDSESD